MADYPLVLFVPSRFGGGRGAVLGAVLNPYSVAVDHRDLSSSPSGTGTYRKIRTPVPGVTCLVARYHVDGANIRYR